MIVWNGVRERNGVIVVVLHTDAQINKRLRSSDGAVLVVGPGQNRTTKVSKSAGVVMEKSFSRALPDDVAFQY